MTVRVGINGFGRIGRSFTRALLSRGSAAGVELVAVNDPMGDAATMAFLLKHDSVGGTLDEDVKATDDGFDIAGASIAKLDVMDPAEIPWADHGVEVVIESTGLFTGRDAAAGAPRGWRQAGRHLGSERRRRRDDLHRRERLGLRPREAHGDLERVVHDELSRAAGEGAQRPLRHRARPDDHGPRLHERPVAPGPLEVDAEGHARSASHAGRCALDHPEQHGGRTRDRSRAARAEGPPRRHLAPGPDADRVDHRSVGRAARGRLDRRHQRRVPRGLRRERRTSRCSSTATSRWSRPTSSATRPRASSRRWTRWRTATW